MSDCVKSYRVFLAFCLVLLGCSSVNAVTPTPPNRNVAQTVGSDPIQIYFYAMPPTNQGIAGVQSFYQDIIDHVGSSSQWGSIGLALTFSYLADTEGTGPSNFSLTDDSKSKYELAVQVAHQMGLKVLVILNGGQWSQPSGAFQAYWKTADGGQYLRRYQDGQVNQSITDKTNTIPATTLSQYLPNWPYDVQGASDSLLLTYSENAVPLVASRTQVLKQALGFWAGLDQKYPGTIAAFTPDGEVSGLSFRKGIQLGFEDYVIQPFCAQNSITSENCQSYFLSHPMNYQTPVGVNWFNYQSNEYRKFVQAQVDTIRTVFKVRPIYTHQIGLPDTTPPPNYSWASPQQTMFVNGARAGFDSYIQGGNNATNHQLVTEVTAKSNGQPWGIVEYNPGQKWTQSKQALAVFTQQELSFLNSNHVKLVGFLSWNGKPPLDWGVRGTGIDDGIKAYLTNGPLPISSTQ